MASVVLVVGDGERTEQLALALTVPFHRLPESYPHSDFTTPVGDPQYADHNPGDDEQTPRTDLVVAGSHVEPHRSWFDTGSDERVGWGAGFVYPPVRIGEYGG